MYCSSTARGSQRRLWDAQNHAIYRRAVWGGALALALAGMPPFNIFLSDL